MANVSAKAVEAGRLCFFEEHLLAMRFDGQTLPIRRSYNEFLCRVCNAYAIAFARADLGAGEAALARL